MGLQALREEELAAAAAAGCRNAPAKSNSLQSKKVIFRGMLVQPCKRGGNAGRAWGGRAWPSCCGRMQAASRHLSELVQAPGILEQYAMRATAAAALLAACLLAATAAAAASRRPQAYPHLQRDWDELRQRCEAAAASCEEGAPRENCVRR